MRTASAPTTALSGKNISEDSLAISTAILAVPYAVLQPNSFDDPGSLSTVSERSQEGEAIDNAMTLDEAASALGPLTGGWVIVSSFFMYSTGGVGVDGRLFVGVTDEDFFRKWCMAGWRTAACRGVRSEAERHHHGLT
jgi:hypothetical protein